MPLVLFEAKIRSSQNSPVGPTVERIVVSAFVWFRSKNPSVPKKEQKGASGSVRKKSCWLAGCCCFFSLFFRGMWWDENAVQVVHQTWKKANLIRKVTSHISLKELQWKPVLKYCNGWKMVKATIACRIWELETEMYWFNIDALDLWPKHLKKKKNSDRS